MSRRHATFTQADVARAIRAAKQAGACSVEVKAGETTIVIRLEQSTGPQEVPQEAAEVIL